MKRKITTAVLMLSLISLQGQSSSCGDPAPTLVQTEPVVTDVVEVVIGTEAVLPDVEYVISLPGVPATDGYGDIMLDITENPVIDPAEFGVLPGQEFNVMAFSYDMQQRIDLLDANFDNYYEPFECCEWVDLISPDFCTKICNAGYCAGSDVINGSDLYTIFSVSGNIAPGQTTSFEAFSLFTEQINEGLAFLPATCRDSISMFCSAYDQNHQVTYVYQPVVSTEDHSNDYLNRKYTTYPNPVLETLYIISQDNLPFKLKIYNTRGEAIIEETHCDPVFDLYVGHLPSGIYFATMENEVQRFLPEYTILVKTIFLQNPGLK